MSRKFLAFDIETAKQVPGDFAAWRDNRPLGICCAATVTSDSGKRAVWHGLNDDRSPSARMNKTEVAELVDYLETMSEQGYEIVTWNGLQFDFDILAEESEKVDSCRELARKHVDMMFQVVCQLGYMLSLQAAAEGMRIGGKLDGMNGQMVPAMWANGEHQRVLEYVEQDALATLELANAVEENGRLDWISRRGRPCDMPLRNGWLSVANALRLPLPDTSWMTNPVTRGSFVEWLSS